MATGPLHFDPFEVLQNDKGEPWILGQGSFGTTYKVQHQKLGRICALKVIRDSLVHGSGEGAERETARFFAEVKALANMHHHGIAVVFEYQDRPEEGYFYYAMEFCKGGNLQELVAQEGPLPWPVARWMVLQVAEALKYAHGCGLLHRDIKPANIMLAEPWPDQQVKLIDFGILQPLEGAAGEGQNVSSTHGGEGVFNDATASPEQMLSGMLDARSDLYSLGITLWWLLIGENPFAGQTRAQLITDRLRSDYANELPAHLDPEAREILLGLLAKRPEDRFADAQALITRITGGLLQSSSQIAAPVAQTAAAPPPPAPVLTTPTPYDENYSIPNPGSDLVTKTGQAAIYRVKQRSSGEIVAAITAEAGMNQETRDGLRTAAAAREDLGCYRMLDWCSSANEEYFIASLPSGQSLLEILRKFGSARAQDAVPLLGALARSFDASMARTTRGIRLELADIRVSSRSGQSDLAAFSGWADIDPGSASSLPSFQSDGDQDVGGTLDISSAGPVNPVSRFAALIYRLISGGNPPYASYFTDSGYVMISGLSEEGNHLLAKALSGGEESTKLESLLNRLANLESISVPGKGTNASTSRTQPVAATASASATVAPPPPPPAVPVQAAAPAANKSAPPLPPVSIPTAPPAHPVAQPAGKKSPLVWIIAGAAALIAVAGGVWVMSSSAAKERKAEADRLEALQRKAQEESAAQFESIRLQMEKKEKEEQASAAEEKRKAEEERQKMAQEREEAMKREQEREAKATDLEVKRLGQILDSNSSSSGDKADAFARIKELADKGHLQAIAICGAAYFNGNGTTKDPKEAYRLFQIGVQNKIPRSMRGLGHWHASGGGGTGEPNLTEAIRWYKEAAKLNDADAAMTLGLLYFNGDKGLEPNKVEGAKWFEVAAKGGVPAAMMTIGHSYKLGNGVEVDPERAFQWYKKAADTGLADALVEVGKCYADGSGVPEDKGKAVTIFQEAAKAGNLEAIVTLGRCYQHGLGVPQDIGEARRLFNQAKNQGHPKAGAFLEELN
ncbi:protein kinase [Luteolibacter sp. GHJ8]|uniref:Protein kinase n=1 Tax=Luteolibacter rhizosphaerae TaxID=2989719 RepID=A0ABT3G4M7_9BACT|nr:protein kinase [Luteolibacter rhizosphaerae]MCW1914778.1 protein kinase [Luteolibacter rhizosphaerae]